MNTFKILMKAGLGATALTAFTAVSAHAGGTTAGTNVQNTFTLDYKVSGINQTQVNNTSAPTSFTVDRKIDVLVEADIGSLDVTPGATAQELVYTVTNEGNDTQKFLLSRVDVTADDYTSTSATAIYYLIGTGTPSLYDPANPPTLAADQKMTVYLRSNTPLTTNDGDEDIWRLVAQVADSAGLPVDKDTDGNSLTGAAENVYADDSGTSEEIVLDGKHSAESKYVVVSADLSGSKDVMVINTFGASIACSPAPTTPTAPTTATPNQYPIPGACVEYVITVTNNGSTASADFISVADAVPGEIGSVSANYSGFVDTDATTAPVTLSVGAGSNSTTNVSLTNGKLAAGQTGYVIIRGLVL